MGTMETRHEPQRERKRDMTNFDAKNITIIPEAKDFAEAARRFPDATDAELLTVAKKIAYVNAQAMLANYRAEKNS